MPEISLQAFYEAVAGTSSREEMLHFLGGRGDVAGSDHPKKYIDTGTEIGVKKSGNHNQTSQFHEVLGYCIYCEEMIHRLHA